MPRPRGTTMNETGARFLFHSNRLEITLQKLFRVPANCEALQEMSKLFFDIFLD